MEDMVKFSTLEKERIMGKSGDVGIVTESEENALVPFHLAW